MEKVGCACIGIDDGGQYAGRLRRNGETKTETAKTEAAKTEPTATEAGTAAGGDAKETAASTGKVEFWNDKFINMEQGDVNKIFDSIGSLSGIGVEPVTYPDTAAYQTAMQQSIRGRRHRASLPGGAARSWKRWQKTVCWRI